MEMVGMGVELRMRQDHHVGTEAPEQRSQVGHQVIPARHAVAIAGQHQRVEATNAADIRLARFHRTECLRRISGHGGQLHAVVPKLYAASRRDSAPERYRQAAPAA
ncbi:hypothetical protein D9M70_569150 [compost metagenome]